ncbi:MAG: hypothetical protein CVU60_05190 [Deltaproteobacteria bacterium HGW-Deltaproteobacteria-18]|jgi:Flp pilus assembly protein TadB|nr:MAG: hypothetical protein CVU60_05190 [Deltaproteobacteria bacterium HGW-Deltaproteobacteria-18]
MSEYRFFLLHKILVLSINALVLGALTVAMYVASGHPDEFTLVFLKLFGGMLLPIIVLGFVAKRRLRRNVDSMCGDAA